MNFVPQKVRALLRVGGLLAGTRRELLQATAPKKIPRTLVIILDGNRRHAAYLGYGQDELTIGHQFGYEAVQKLIRAAFEYGVERVVVWAASKANFDERKMAGMRNIMHIFAKEVREQLENPPKPDEQVHFHVVGEEWLKYCDEDPELPRDVQRLEAQTAKYDTKRKLIVLFGYSGRPDIVHAIKGMMNYVIANELTAEQVNAYVTEETVGMYMLSREVGDVDMVIRTGEKEEEAHWSQCLLPWWMQKTEFFFTATLLPAFTVKELQGMFAAIATRRSLGGK